VPNAIWVTAASLHMENNAARWLQVFKLKQRLGNWQQFASAVLAKFGADEYPKALHSLLYLRQIEGVEEYSAASDQARYSAAVHNKDLDEMFFVTQFIKGMKPEILSAVQMQLPSSVDRAALLAQLQQEVLEKGKFKAAKSSYGSKPSGGFIKQEAKSATTGDLSKERQVCEYRRVNGLCYACGEKFEPGHLAKCAKRTQIRLNSLVTDDGEMILTDDILQKLDREDVAREEFCHLSLSALSGTDDAGSMRVRALSKKQVMLILVDSGRSSTFISTTMVARIGLKHVSCAATTVRVANGDMLISDTYVPKVQWWANGHTYKTDMRVLDPNI
jgi:hypothetical protein